jgi:lambda family phage portal protein
MFERFKRLFTRSFDGAAGGRRWRGQPEMRSPVSASLQARGTLAARARYAVANNPLAAAAVQAWVTQAIGAGIKPSSLHTNPATKETINAAFSDWVDVADADGRTDWFGVQAALFRSMAVAGEGLAVMLNTEAGLRIRVLDPEQLDASHTVQIEGGARIISGVEFDVAGQRIAYHIFDYPPGLEHAFQRQRRRIPAEDVLHVYRQDWPGMVRGVSWLAPAMLRLSDLDGWSDAMLMKLKTSSLLTGFVTSTDGSGAPFEGERTGSTLVGGLEPGVIKFLEPNQSIDFSEPANVGSEAIQFSEVCERHVAAALGLPAHVFGDVTEANYSSLKTAQVAWKARVEAVQWHTFIPIVCVPVWRRWAAVTVLSGKIETTVDEATRVKHHTPSWVTLEPVKEMTAKVMALRSGLTSQRALLAEQGEDVEVLFREIADDAALAESLGLSFPALTTANDNNQTAQDEPAPAPVRKRRAKKS